MTHMLRQFGAKVGYESVLQPLMRECTSNGGLNNGQLTRAYLQQAGLQLGKEPKSKAARPKGVPTSGFLMYQNHCLRKAKVALERDMTEGERKQTMENVKN